MVLALEDFRQKALAFQMFEEFCLCSLFIEFERDYVIGLQKAFEIAFHNNGVAAIGATRRRRVFVADYLAAAGIADVNAHSLGFALLPLFSGFGLPLHIVGGLFFKILVVCFKCFNIKFGIAVRAF